MEKFDVIVVGAGLAGLAAAYTLAQSGVEVLVLEKGDYPGAKNVTGGRLYVNPVRDLFPGLWDNAPFERHIVHEQVAVVARERSLTLSYTGDELTHPPYQSHSILRARFDRWLGQQAEKQGAMLVTKSKVDELIIDHGKVIGVRTGGDELGADVVIAADGVLSLVAEQAGLRQPGDLHHFAVGFKEVIELDRAVIEDRFNLEGDQGAARLFMGEVTRGKFGGGFLYTNKESLSLGIVVGIKDLMEIKPALQAPVLLDEFKQRPEVARLIRDGQTVEYSAHVIPEGGMKALGSLYGDGILLAGDAAGLAMNIGVTVRGMEYALASGYFAARAVLKARESGDFTASSLKVYQDLLEASFVLQDFRSFQEAPGVLENPRFFQYYPELAGSMMRDLYAVPAGPKEKLYTSIKRYLSFGELWAMFNDLRKVMKI
ncbi:MAG TPA: FAD-dependent oxidoreductase [Syntrophomonadaceae bacterium]|nr:FAD-dependent oxidoreductase [Syntrophomonadaceae bacterium]